MPGLTYNRWLHDRAQQELEHQTEEYYRSLSKGERKEDQQWSKISSRSARRLTVSEAGTKLTVATDAYALRRTFCCWARWVVAIQRSMASFLNRQTLPNFQDGSVPSRAIR